ncbi:hypothetical protein Tco_0816520 [Tanacetum coccineum]
MPWRHPGSCVNDLVPKIGFNPEDVKKLGEFVVKLRNIPMGVLVILGLSRAWWNHRCDPVIREGNNGSEVQAEAHGLSCVIQERIPNNTTLPDAPRIVIPTPRATRERIQNNTTSLDAYRTAIPDRATEQLEVTLSGEKVLARVEATRKRKASTAVGISTESSHRNRPIRRSSRADSSLRQLSNDGSEQEDQASESRSLDGDDLDMNDRGEQKNEDQVLNVLPLRSVGVAKGGNVGCQAMPPPQEIHTEFDHRGSGADDLGNQVADDAPMNGNDYEIDGGNDHSHDGGHPSTITVLSIEKIFPSFFLFIFLSIFSLTPYNEVDVENHEEPEQASSVPNDTSDRIEREIASPVPSPYYLPYPFEEGERSNHAMYLGRSRRSIMIQSELEIMTSDVKDLKKSLAERESELLGLKDEILTSRSIGPSSFNFLSIFFQGFQTCQVSVEALEPEKLPIAPSSKVSESAPEEVSSNVIGYHQDDVGIEESHHGPSDALHNPS